MSKGGDNDIAPVASSTFALASLVPPDSNTFHESSGFYLCSIFPKFEITNLNFPNVQFPSLVFRMFEFPNCNFHEMWEFEIWFFNVPNLCELRKFECSKVRLFGFLIICSNLVWGDVYVRSVRVLAFLFSKYGLRFAQLGCCMFELLV